MSRVITPKTASPIWLIITWSSMIFRNDKFGKYGQNRNGAFFHGIFVRTRDHPYARIRTEIQYTRTVPATTLYYTVFNISFVNTFYPRTLCRQEQSFEPLLYISLRVHGTHGVSRNPKSPLRKSTLQWI